MTKQSNSAPFAITVSLAFVLIGVLMFALMLGMVPDGSKTLVHHRLALCETIAVNASLAIQRQDMAMMRQGLNAAVSRNDELLQAVVTRTGGTVVHRQGAKQDPRTKLDSVTVPVALNGNSWGTVRLAFRPIRKGTLGLMNTPTLRLIAFIGGSGFVLVYIYLNRVLQHLDPSRVVPERVRTTLNTLAEGLVVIDEHEKIVLVNNSFAKLLGELPEKLVGREIKSLPWDQVTDDFPWATAISTGEVNTGCVLRMLDLQGESRTFRVNSSPIIGENGDCEGALTSFDDVTALEQRTLALTQMLDRLKNSRDKIRRQNEELHILATRDPLTSALNRRSLFEQVDPLWQAAKASNQPISCCLIDIDHFKSVNDNHGHAMGDFVLKTLVSVIGENVGKNDLVCRYGGEEFCIVFPGATAAEATTFNEHIRMAIAEHDFNGLHITASVGVSGIEFKAADFAKMQDQADQALYFSKRHGRNQVTRFDLVPADFDLQSTPDGVGNRPVHVSPIPVQTVSCLLSALAYRDIATAEHSRRVADLCVRMADGLFSCSESYLLENAALLHDIGKLGVPDSILLKPDALTKDEWEIMQSHEGISVDIIRSTFVCDELTEIVRTHHAWFSGDENESDLPTGENIPLASRILSIADSYDAMVSDRVYRKGKTKEEALAELRKCAGTQFDPHLVERFVALIGRQDDTTHSLNLLPDKKIALKLGVEIERLARAIDDHDVNSLRSLVDSVHVTAKAYSLQAIVDLTEELQASVGEGNDDWLNTLELTIDLIELCRITQRAHLDTTAARQHLSSTLGAKNQTPEPSAPASSSRSDSANS